MPSTKAHITSVRLDAWQHRALAKHAESMDRSVSYVVQTAVNLLLRQHGYSALDEEPAAPVARTAGAAGERVLEQLESAALAAREAPPAPAPKAPAKPAAPGPSSGLEMAAQFRARMAELNSSDKPPAKKKTKSLADQRAERAAKRGSIPS